MTNIITPLFPQGPILNSRLGNNFATICKLLWPCPKYMILKSLPGPDRPSTHEQRTISFITYSFISKTKINSKSTNVYQPHITSPPNIHHHQIISQHLWMVRSMVYDGSLFNGIWWRNWLALSHTLALDFLMLITHFLIPFGSFSVWFGFIIPREFKIQAYGE